MRKEERRDMDNEDRRGRRTRPWRGREQRMGGMAGRCWDGGKEEERERKGRGMHSGKVSWR